MSAWKPTATFERLRFRAACLKQIRVFFESRDYLEVETPALSRFGITDVYLNQLQTTCFGKAYYLQTSPEYAMKRLLAAGSGPIFQIARVFRDDECGRWHQPEFTLLEWYQLGVDHHQLLLEVEQLLRPLLQSEAFIRMTYQAAFERYCGVNPHTAELAQLRAVLSIHALDNVLPVDETDRDQYLFLLMSHVVEPAFATLSAPVAVYDFPPSQAALARVIDGKAARFEVYYRGVELANGFYELTDPKEQAARFEAEQRIRLLRGLPESQIDTDLLAALAYGLPDCSGVAVGLDRVLALAAGCERLEEMIACCTN